MKNKDGYTCLHCNNYYECMAQSVLKDGIYSSGSCENFSLREKPKPRNGLRPCTVIVCEKYSDGIKVMQESKKGYFHRWAEITLPIVKLGLKNFQKAIGPMSAIIKQMRENFVISGGNGEAEVYMQKKTVGIVEFEDGTVAEAEPTSIKFEV